VGGDEILHVRERRYERDSLAGSGGRMIGDE
jgi:hypothetical protein